jgi:hypothetical protein
MHIEVPFPENAGPGPILLTVIAEGKAHEFLKTVNNLEGHKTGFEVYLSPVNHGPVIELVSPSAGLFAGDTVIFQLTGSGFDEVQAAAIIDPANNPPTICFTIQGHVLIPAGTLIGANKLYYREVITTFGLELADGSTVTARTRLPSA